MFPLLPKARFICLDNKPFMYKSLAFVLTAIFAAQNLLAQDGKLIDIDIDLNKKEWYENYWVWIGAAIFIIVVLLILRRPKS